MSDNPAPDAGGAPDIAALIQQASDTSLPISGRNAILAKIEAYHQGNAASADQAAAAQSDEAAAEAFAQPSSGLGYQLEQSLPADVAIVDPAGLGALKGALATAGVPAEQANAAFGHIAELHRDGAFQSERSYTDAVTTARNQLHRVHGEAAKGIIADALSWIDEAVRANPALEEAATAALASPQAIMAAANMKRFGAPRR